MNRFWSKVDKKSSTRHLDGSSCWEWMGCRNAAGYGRFMLNRKVEQAHRVAYRLVRGEIPVGLHIDHLCRNRGCVNPLHLEAVTSAENILRGEGRAAKAARQERCVNGHDFSRTAAGKRFCRTCYNDWARARYWARKAVA